MWTLKERSHHQRWSSTKGHFPPKVVFHRWSSSTDSHLPPKVVFHWRLSFTEGCLPPKVIFHQRSSTIKGCLGYDVWWWYLRALFLFGKKFWEANSCPVSIFGSQFHVWHKRLQLNVDRSTIKPWLILYLKFFWTKPWTHKVTCWFLLRTIYRFPIYVIFFLKASLIDIYA